MIQKTMACEPTEKSSPEGSSERSKWAILVGICSEHGYSERREAVRATWLKHSQEGVECLFFLGGEVPEGERNDTVGLDVSDDFSSKPNKVLSFFRYALKYYAFDWLFKCDDDTYVDLSRLPELADPRYGIVGDMLMEKRGVPSGGAGYLLSREIVEKIVAQGDLSSTGAEDMIFDKLVLDSDLVPHITPRLCMSNDDYPGEHNDKVSAQGCNPELMCMLELLRHGSPDTVCKGEHPHWKDELLFYKEGVFRRRSSSCYGWWSVSPYNNLILRWKIWGEEQLLWNGETFCGNELEIRPASECAKGCEDSSLFSFCGRSPEEWTVNIERAGVSERLGAIHGLENVCVAPLFFEGLRTGNRLFQIAAVYAHALRHGLECRVPWRSEAQTRRLYELLGTDALACPDGGYFDPVIYREPNFSYDPIPARIRQGRLNGYFQSEKYFADYEEEIRRLYARLKAPRRKNEAGVHVRMGDYLNMPEKFRSPDATFLEEALDRLSRGICKLHIFSDSPRQALALVRSLPASRRFELVLNEEDTLGALRSMSGVQELVMSCSSYSWWAAYLGEPDQVIVQKDWFTGEISDYQDVYRDQWTKV